MSLLWAGLVVALAVGLAVSALLLVRRRAPDGSFFATARRDGAHTGRARSGTSARGPERAASLRRERGPGSVSRADHPHRTMPDGGLGAIVYRVNLGTETRPARAA